MPPSDPFPALLARLESLAAAATPGPYRFRNEGPVGKSGVVVRGRGGQIVADVSCGASSPRIPADAAFLAACSPDVIRRLVEAARAGEKCARAWDAWHQHGFLAGTECGQQGHHSGACVKKLRLRMEAVAATEVVLSACSASAGEKGDR